MKTIRLILILLAIALQARSQQIVEVNADDHKASLTDLTGTDLTRRYCLAEGRQCPGEDIEEAKFASTLRQCSTRCSQSRQCLNAVYTAADKKCHLRADRCNQDQLQPSPGVKNLYRLKEGETCEGFQPEYSEEHKKYAGKFCMWFGKSCPGRSLYKKPQNIPTYEECLKKCVKIKSCAGADFNFKDKKCDPKSSMCSDTDLTPDPNIQNFLRLEEGVEECPGNRAPPSDTAPPHQITKIFTTQHHVVRHGSQPGGFHHGVVGSHTTGPASLGLIKQFHGFSGHQGGGGYKTHGGGIRVQQNGGTNVQSGVQLGGHGKLGYGLMGTSGGTYRTYVHKTPGTVVHRRVVSTSGGSHGGSASYGLGGIRSSTHGTQSGPGSHGSRTVHRVVTHRVSGSNNGGIHGYHGGLHRFLQTFHRRQRK